MAAEDYNPDYGPYDEPDPFDFNDSRPQRGSRGNGWAPPNPGPTPGSWDGPPSGQRPAPKQERPAPSQPRPTDLITINPKRENMANHLTIIQTERPPEGLSGRVWSSLESQIQALEAPIPATAVKKRAGSRCTHDKKQTPPGCRTCLSYVDGTYTREVLDRIFGPHRWTHQVLELRQTPSPRQEQMDFVAVVRLEVTFADGTVVPHEDVGYGNEVVGKGRMPTSELAVKEAITDGIKRCSINLGNVFGRGLYDKENPVHLGGEDTHGVQPPDPKVELAGRLWAAMGNNFIRHEEFIAFCRTLVSPDGTYHPIGDLQRPLVKRDVWSGIQLLNPEDVKKTAEWVDSKTKSLAAKAPNFEE